MAERLTAEQLAALASGDTVTIESYRDGFARTHPSTQTTPKATCCSNGRRPSATRPTTPRGHLRIYRKAAEELDETDEVEGHRRYIVRADAERDETDDTEGHAGRWGADAERVESDDTQGHGARRPAEGHQGDDPDDDTKGTSIRGGRTGT